ncbi:conserved hypothetical protein (putative transposase or invertase), partial [Thermosyntropha lipolytica DSM 11003]
RREGMEEGIRKGIEQGIAKGIEQGIEKGIEKGIKKGIEKGKEEAALNALQKWLDIETIADITGIAVERIEELN